MTSSSVGDSLAVYNSMFSGKLSTSLQCQLATIYKLMILREEDSGEVVDPHIQVHIPNLPQQQGVADCAIAYAFHAARGDSLEDIEFGQDKMWQHLARCLTNDSFSTLTKACLCSTVHMVSIPGNRRVLHLQNARMLDNM